MVAVFCRNVAPVTVRARWLLISTAPPRTAALEVNEAAPTVTEPEFSAMAPPPSAAPTAVAVLLVNAPETIATEPPSTRMAPPLGPRLFVKVTPVRVAVLPSP